MADIKIDSKLFQERISHFATAWKNDLRSKDSLFGGASSILIMMGKMEEVPEFHKNNAMHVSFLIALRQSMRSDEISATNRPSNSSGFSATSFRRPSCSSLSRRCIF